MTRSLLLSDLSSRNQSLEDPAHRIWSLSILDPQRRQKQGSSLGLECAWVRSPVVSELIPVVDDVAGDSIPRRRVWQARKKLAPPHPGEQSTEGPRLVHRDIQLFHVRGFLAFTPGFEGQTQLIVSA